MNLDLYFILMFSDLEMIDYVYVLLIVAFKILNKIFLEMYYRSCKNSTCTVWSIVVWRGWWEQFIAALGDKEGFTSTENLKTREKQSVCFLLPLYIGHSKQCQW